MIWFFLAGMIAGAVGLYLVAAAFARREEEAALEEDIAELKKTSMKGRTMLEGLDWMTEQMATGEYLTKDDVLQVIDIYNNALKRWLDERNEVEEREQAEIGGGELDGTASEGTESGGEGRKTDPE